MKAKNLFRIALFAVVVCMILSVCALADSKVIRFDGEGDINLGLDNVTTGKDFATESLVNGIYRIGIKNDSLLTGSGSVNAQPTFTLPSTFELYDYPYMAIKYKTNFSGNLHVYLNAPGGGYLYSNISPANKNNGEAFMLCFPHQDQTTLGNTAADGSSGFDRYTYIYPHNRQEIRTSGESATANPRFPTEEEKMTIRSFFFQFRDLTDTQKAALDGAGVYVDIESIGFFSTEKEMIKYADPYKLISFNNDDSNIDFTISHTTSLGDVTTENGVYQFKTNTDKAGTFASGSFQPYNIALNSIDHFYLYDYPYVKVKQKTNLINHYQFYMNHYLVTPDSPGGTKKDNEFVVEANNPFCSRAGTEVTKELLYAPEFGTDSSNTVTYSYYTATDGIRWTARTANGGKNLPYYTSETDYDYALIKDIFLQCKTDKYTDLTSKIYYDDLYYIAFFPDEASMKAFGAEETAAVLDAKESIENSTFTFALHQGNTIEDLEDTVTAQLEAMYPNVDLDITFGEVADNACPITVHISSFYANRDYNVNATVNVVELDAFETVTLGAQIRTEGPQGLRFGMQIADYDAAGYDEGSIVYGAVIGADGIIPVLSDEDNFAVISSSDDNFNSETEDGVTSYNIVAINIPEEHYAVSVTARPYVTYKVNGETFTHYGKSVTKCVNDVIAVSGWNK